jgi:hypothetical protein
MVNKTLESVSAEDAGLSISFGQMQSILAHMGVVAGAVGSADCPCICGIQWPHGCEPASLRDANVEGRP